MIIELASKEKVPIVLEVKVYKLLASFRLFFRLYLILNRPTNK
jgi:hypothetical protein